MLPAPHDNTSCLSCGQAFSSEALFCPACGTAKSRNLDGDPLLGTRVGERFLITERLGHGASGTIYRAEHVTLRRKVAVKVLHYELSRDDLAVERFRREATTVSDIDNEHIVQIHDFGRIPDGRLYLAMELLEGETLGSVLRREKQLPIDKAVDILIQLGEALMEAHAMGYVHRDLRPRNIYLAVRRGRANFVKLLDFGLAKLVEKEGEAASTSLGMTFGEPKYMSPEQARGEPVDRRADIYSLGCIAYQMLAGQPPFTSGKVFDILTRHVDTMPAPLSERRDDVPDWLDSAVMRMLAKRAEDRFITVFRLIEALRQGLDRGSTMAAARALRRETVQPPSVTQAMAKLGHAAAEASEQAGTGDTEQTGVPEPADTALTERNSDRIEKALRSAEPRDIGDRDDAPLHLGESTDSPRPVDKNDKHSEVDEDFRKTVKREPAAAKVEKPSVSGKRAGTATGSGSSSGISAAWYADGDALDDEDTELSERHQKKLSAARGPDATGQMSLDDEFFDEPRSRVPLVAGALGGAVLLVALIAYFASSGGSSANPGESGPTPATNAAAGSNAAAEVTPADAARTAAVLPSSDAGSPAPVPPRTTNVPGTASPTGPKNDRGETKKSTKTAKRKPKTGKKPHHHRPTKRDPKTVVRRDPLERDPPDTHRPSDASGESKKQADFFAKLGQTSLRSGDILGAASKFNKALKLNPRNVTAIAGLGEIALSQGSYRAAVGHLKKATRMRKGSSRIWALLGDAYLGAGQTKRASDAYKRALKINPDNARARDGYNEATRGLDP